jgi:heme A synthase
MDSPKPLRRSLATTAFAIVSIMVLIGALWVSISGPQTVAASDLLLSTILLASLIFPLAYLWTSARVGANKPIPARFMLWMSILWMLVSVAGTTVNLWSGLSVSGPWSLMRSIQFWAVLALFSGMFVSSLVQLATAADFYIKESAARYSCRARYQYRPRTA